MVNAVTLTLPVPTLQSIGLESDVMANIVGTCWLTLPTSQLEIGLQGNSGAVAFALLAPTLAVSGFTPVSGAVRFTLPTPQLVSRGSVAGVGAVAFTLPVPQLTIHGPNAAALTLPVPQLYIVGTAGAVGTVTLVLPTPTFAARGNVPFAGGVSLALPAPKLQVFGATGNIGAVALSLRGLASAIQGVTGAVGTVQLFLPVPALHVAGYQNAVGVVQLTLPMLYLQATGQVNVATPDEPDGIAWGAVVMNTETGALSHYLNYPFNSFARFNGLLLGSSAEGLFVLGGDTDNDAIIQAAARVGIADFNTSFRKRAQRIYVGYRTDGNLLLRVITDETNARDYLLGTTNRTGLHGSHVRVGKGVEARYWQFELQNTDGAAFDMNAIELKIQRLSRRIGGGDA